MTTSLNFQCDVCRRFDLETRATCEAYPEIPDEVLLGLLDHRVPREGDHGLLFLPPEGFVPPWGGVRKHHPGGQDHDQLDHGRKGNGRPGVQEAPVLTYRQERARARAAWEESVIAAAEAWQQDRLEWQRNVDGAQIAAEYLIRGETPPKSIPVASLRHPTNLTFAENAAGAMVIRPEDIRNAEALIKAVRTAPPAPELHRGIAIIGKDPEALFLEGREIDLTLQSFSADGKFATDWAFRQGTINKSPVVLHLEAGAQALDLDPIARDTMYEWAKEYITAGRFKIIKKGYYPNDGAYHVHLKQVRVP